MSNFVKVEVKDGLLPAISIGLPVYNGATQLRRALDSLQAQIFCNFEIIISNNYSTDETAGICQEYASKDPRIRYFLQSENIGPMLNFKFTLDKARASVFMWAAHDDLWDPEHLMNAINLLKKPGVRFVFPSFRLSSIKWKVEKNFDPKIFEFIEAPDADIRVLNFISLHYMSHSANIVYSVFNKAFLFDVWERQNVGNDGAMGAVILSLGKGALNSSVFCKRHRNLWPGKLQVFLSLFSCWLRGVDGTLAAREALRTAELTFINLFPVHTAKIRFIFSHYRPFTYGVRYRVCAFSEIQEIT